MEYLERRLIFSLLFFFGNTDTAMNSQLIQLLKKLLPGLLPLIIFIIVDEVWGTRAGLIVAIIFGFTELIVILLKERRLDWFIIFDTALLMMLGAVSLLSDNDIFFKLKPAFINVIFCVIIGLSAFSNSNLIMLYSKRYLKDLPDDPNLQKEMRRTFRSIFWIFFLHTVLIVYSAFYLSKPAWAFISGGLLYILFILFFGWQFLNRWIHDRKMRDEEWFPLVNDEGAVIGKATRSQVHSTPGMLHPVVHLHVINRKSEIYLQKRAANKDIQPGKWDSSVGGHVGIDETIEHALVREAQEELNLTGFDPAPLCKYRWDSELESELVFSFIALVEHPISHNPSEIADGRFWKISDIDLLIGKNILTPNFENEYNLLKQAILSFHL
ncbi:MAG: NUDIX domain-containing protein [Bacteroidetes bacterium]|nr:NUDIX domain-containing protein [Bacteroidota bacterium]